MKRRLAMILAGTVAAFEGAKADDSFGRCFAAEQVEPIAAAVPALQMRADELTQQRMNAADKATVIYLLGRQVVLLERVLRRAQSTDLYACEVALDGLRRDFAMLKRTNSAFRMGNQELEIDKIDDPASAPILAEIDAQLGGLEKHVAALVMAPSD